MGEQGAELDDDGLKLLFVQTVIVIDVVSACF